MGSGFSSDSFYSDPSIIYVLRRVLALIADLPSPHRRLPAFSCPKMESSHPNRERRKSDIEREGRIIWNEKADKVN